jgi:hypothetical protein
MDCDSPVYHGPAMASGTELIGDGHVAISGAGELDVTTLGERGDRCVLTVCSGGGGVAESVRR